ncbi:hypothetical protein D7X30_06100 [Corallococcus sp. AB011P]|uniref:hypothetical protein n=1 Tax=Corallococcus sp. AB011P TaxID=2316735 RepID=UPI000EA0B4F0|nr:hypothetical protein [Corallococcus sp. AB011P]RKG60511.1 hypothetical protein D7X30_06100 [Corallococcus sp. AB011P]
MTSTPAPIPGNEPNAQPRCALHSRVAMVACSRCGAFMCRSCIAPDSEPAHCRACRKHLLATGAIIPSNRSTLGEYLAQFSWLLAFLTAGGIYLADRRTTSELWLIILLVGVTLGLACGVAALIREKGRLSPRVVVPAIIGIVLNTPPFLWAMLIVVLPVIVGRW